MFNKSARNRVRTAEVKALEAQAEVARVQARQARIEQGLTTRLDERILRKAAKRRGVVHTPPGWHPNPSGEGLRYWDGMGWTEHVALQDSTGAATLTTQPQPPQES